MRRLLALLIFMAVALTACEQLEAQPPVLAHYKAMATPLVQSDYVMWYLDADNVKHQVTCWRSLGTWADTTWVEFTLPVDVKAQAFAAATYSPVYDPERVTLRLYYEGSLVRSGVSNAMDTVAVWYKPKVLR